MGSERSENPGPCPECGLTYWAYTPCGEPHCECPVEIPVDTTLLLMNRLDALERGLNALQACLPDDATPCAYCRDRIYRLGEGLNMTKAEVCVACCWGPGGGEDNNFTMLGV